MPIAVCKWFNKEKGYGFLQPDNGGADVFVHINDLLNSGISDLKENQKVSYEMKIGKNGKSSAGNVKLI